MLDRALFCQLVRNGAEVQILSTDGAKLAKSKILICFGAMAEPVLLELLHSEIVCYVTESSEKDKKVCCYKIAKFDLLHPS